MNDGTTTGRLYLKSSYYSIGADTSSGGGATVAGASLHLNTGRLSNPSTCFFAFDSTYTKETTGSKQCSYCIDGWGCDKAAVHGSRANVHFVDAHVETLTPQGWSGIIHENRTDYVSNHLYIYDVAEPTSQWWNISGL